ncbi:MAG: autotransporter assembly complex family protein [Kiloniellaceae bacterium]
MVEAEEPASLTPYEVTLEGVEDDTLLAALRASSQLIVLADKPPATNVGLRRRARDDIEGLKTVLRSEGFYQSQVDLEIDTEVSPVQVRVKIATGPRYSLAAYNVTYLGNAMPEDGDLPSLEDIGVDIGMPARAPEVIEAELTLVRLLQERGHPFARVDGRKTFVDHEKSEMTVELSIDSGPVATLGPLTFEGSENVEPDYLRRIAGWPEGDAYDRRIVRETQRRISSTGLFSSVNAEAPPEPQADGSLPVTVTLVEREHRSIGATASISTDIGPGGEIFWEHRNLFGQNEKLKLSATGSLIEQSGAISFRKPAFLERDQALLAELTGGLEDNDAFQRQAVDGLVALERPFLENWRVSAGVAAGYSIVDENADSGDGEQAFTLFGLPLTANRDTTDDALDPASGSRLQLSLTPTTGVGDKPLFFLTAVAGGSAYYAIDDAERFILAGRARVGSIVGEKTESLPADRRFFAGGGGSVRGYEYQLVGPLDDDEDPFGGVSLVEVGAEVRVRVTEEIGVVPFIDGGTVYDDPWPNGEETLRWAAGLGLRYFTGFGPVRLDVAFPLNPRDGVDEAFQFYISFGQAF